IILSSPRRQHIQLLVEDPASPAWQEPTPDSIWKVFFLCDVAKKTTNRIKRCSFGGHERHSGCKISAKRQDIKQPLLRCRASSHFNVMSPLRRHLICKSPERTAKAGWSPDRTPSLHFAHDRDPTYSYIPILMPTRLPLTRNNTYSRSGEIKIS